MGSGHEKRKEKLGERKDVEKCLELVARWAAVRRFTTQVSFKASRELTSLSCFSTNKVNTKKERKTKEQSSKNQVMDERKMLHLAKSSTVSVRFPPEISNGNLSVLYVVSTAHNITGITQHKRGDHRHLTFTSITLISKGWLMLVQGAVWQHFPSLQLHRQPIFSCQNSLVQVFFVILIISVPLVCWYP